MESTTYFQKPCSVHGSYRLVSWLAPYLVSPQILGNRCCTCRHEMPVPSPSCASREPDQQFWKLDMDINGRGMMLQTFLGEQKPASGDEASECHAGDHRLSAILCPCKPRRPEIGIHLERVQLSEGLRKDDQSFNSPGNRNSSRDLGVATKKARGRTSCCLEKKPSRTPGRTHTGCNMEEQDCRRRWSSGSSWKSRTAKFTALVCNCWEEDRRI
jgi:hypothetical protein